MGVEGLVSAQSLSSWVIYLRRLGCLRGSKKQTLRRKHEKILRRGHLSTYRSGIDGRVKFCGKGNAIPGGT